MIWSKGSFVFLFKNCWLSFVIWSSLLDSYRGAVWVRQRYLHFLSKVTIITQVMEVILFTSKYLVLFLFDCRCTGWKIEKTKCKGIKNLLATFLDWFEGLVVWYENFGNHRGEYTSDSAKSVANRYAIFLFSVDDSLIGQLTTKCVQCADQRCKIKLFKCPL